MCCKTPDIFNEDRTALDLNNPGALEALQFVYDLMHVDRVALSTIEFTQSNSQGEMFINNLIAMETGGLWRVSTYYEGLGDRLGIAHLPMRHREGNTVHNLAYTSYANSPNREAIRLFMEFATTTAHSDYVAQTFLPAHADSQHLWFERFPNINVGVFGEVLEFATPNPIAATNAGPAATVLAQELERLFISGDGITPEALEAINAAVDEIINQ